MNKNAIIYSIDYDLNDNLYGCVGILYTLQLNINDCDIYINTTNINKNIILKICNQEKYKINNIYFNTFDNYNLSDLWCLKNFFDIYNNYNYVYIKNSSHEYGHNFTNLLTNKHNIYSILPYTDELLFNFDNNLINTNYYILDCNMPNLQKRYEIFQDVYDKLKNLDCYHTKYIIDFFFIDLLYKNNILYININDKYSSDNYISEHNNYITYIDYYEQVKDIKKSKYYNNGNYLLDNKYIPYNKYIYTCKNHNNNSSIYIKYICLNIKQKILGYT